MGDHLSMGEQTFDSTGLIRRARRMADLSQRELADRIGLSKSTIAAIEVGRQQVTVDALVQVLHAAGLRLFVVDDTGAVVDPMRSDAPRDAAGRRYPAHLDLREPSRLIRWELGRSRIRPTPRMIFEHRDLRDLRRSHEGMRRDHPSVGERSFRPRRRQPASDRLAQLFAELMGSEQYKRHETEDQRDDRDNPIDRDRSTVRRGRYP